MTKKFYLLVLLLFIALLTSGTAQAHSPEAIYELNDQLRQKFPNVEAIKEQFGDEAKWQARTAPSLHDDNLELRIDSMEYPGIEISTVGFTLDGEVYFFLVLVNVEKAGYVKFLDLDVGSARADVIRAFGEPQQVEGNELTYFDDSEYMVVKFIIENNNVAGMRLINYLD